MDLSLDLMPQWKAQAARLLAENTRRHDRPMVLRVARKVGKAERSVYRLLRDLREAHEQLSA